MQPIEATAPIQTSLLAPTRRGKLVDRWTYTFATAASYEAFNRLEGLENSAFSPSVKINRKFGENYNFSLAYAHAQEYDKFFDKHSRTLHVFTASLNQEIEIKGTGWSVIPGIDLNRQVAQGVLSDAFIGVATINFGWTDCREKKNFGCWDLAFRPGFRLSYFEDYPTQVRKDLRPSFAAEATYQITPDVALSAGLVGQYNDSNIPQRTYRRVDFVPQLSLKRTLYDDRRTQ